MNRNPKLLSGLIGTPFIIGGSLLILTHTLILNWSIDFAEQYLSADHHITSRSVMTLSTYILTFAVLFLVLGIAAFLLMDSFIRSKAKHMVEEMFSAQRGLLKNQFLVLLAICMPTICILAIIGWQNTIQVSLLTRDPIAVFEGPFYIGLLSKIGIIFWCSSAAICLFTFSVLHRKNNHNDMSSFILFLGLMTSFLLLDDFFLLHDRIFPLLFHINEKVIFSVYGLALLICLIRFNKTILKTEYFILIFAFGFFVLSLINDRNFLPVSENLHYLFEDGSKLLGIICWFTYLTRLCLKMFKVKL